jgi:dCTP diphosphatase
MKRDWQSLRNLILAFRNARDWKQFHTPKNLSVAIAVEAAELQERFLWQTDAEAKTALGDPKKREKVVEELADVFIFALLLADSLDLDVDRIVRKKVKQNARKYPVKKAKGNHSKYSELAE